ncbi:MAG: CYTH domain-containing protein [Oscillospiraceae bacterium]|nr:CYTH domain-containing protein [Oscillospiraceae bacterium]
MEFERKLAVMEEETMTRILEDPAICGRMAEPLRKIQMETTYYDAPDGGLSAKKWTLRRRMEGGAPVVTVKTPCGLPYARGEWETAGDDVLAALPALVRLGAPAALLEIRAVQPVCGAAFVRRAVLLALDGSCVELALDVGRLFRENRSQPLRELELELKGGEAAPMLALTESLKRRYGLREEEKSKFYRAFRL